jgi:hypothetical protein
MGYLDLSVFSPPFSSISHRSYHANGYRIASTLIAAALEAAGESGEEIE